VKANGKGDIFPPKRRLTYNGLHSVMSQKIILFKTTSERSSDPTKVELIAPFKVLTAVTTKNTNFWGVMLLIWRDSDLSEGNIAFNGVEEYKKKHTNRNSRQTEPTEDVGDKFIRNVRLSPHYTALQSRGPHFSTPLIVYVTVQLNSLMCKSRCNTLRV
jgi:hypothetical protein